MRGLFDGMKAFFNKEELCRLPAEVKEAIAKILERYCEQRVPAHVRDKLNNKYTFSGNAVTLWECRPFYRDPTHWTEHPFAQFRYNTADKTWMLYCADRNSQWHIYEPAKPNTSVEALLMEMDIDETGIFFG